ncbi:MAG: hypothetical protein ACLSVD_06620 [Eggerthellaceae bacterium]
MLVGGGARIVRLSWRSTHATPCSPLYETGLIVVHDDLLQLDAQLTRRRRL